jgi:hypothetical protein
MPLAEVLHQVFEEFYDVKEAFSGSRHCGRIVEERATSQQLQLLIYFVN